MEINRGGKKYRKASELVDRSKKHTIDEALSLVVQTGYAKFDESIDCVFVLGVDAKQGDQQVRGAVVLPHGSGKSARVIVFAKGEKAKEAEAAGADLVGTDDLIQKINDGWLEFDKAIATPDMMAAISKVAKVLGPRGLMPNPKVGTVTMDVRKAVEEQKKGKVSFRTDKSGLVHCMIGKRSFGAEKLKDNFTALFGQIMRMKPATSKGIYLKKVTLSTTMGPPVQVSPSESSRVGA